MNDGIFSDRFLEMLAGAQNLIRQRYGEGAFVQYAGWRKRHVVGTEWDKGKGKYVRVYSDGKRG